MKTILCPTDFSACSENAAVYASKIAKEFDSRLILLHVYETPMIYMNEPLLAIDELELSAQAIANKGLKKLKVKLLKENKFLKVETQVEEGNISDHIKAIADQEQVDLIIMGTTGKSRMKRIVLGSTSSHAIAKAGCPVLCIPKGDKYQGIKKIVFATDLNKDNMNAAMSLVTFAKHFDAEIIFVYVDEHLIYSDEQISDMTKKIRTHVSYNKMSGYISKNTSVTEGLEYFLKKNPADMLVMFSHEKHFPKTLINPSITKEMTSQSHIPLLALPVNTHTLTGA